MSRPKNSLMRALFASVASLLVFAAVAVAIERPEYVAQVEPICKTNKEASDRYLKGVKKLVKQDKLKQAGTAFKKAAAGARKGPQVPVRGRKARGGLGEADQVAV